MKSCPGLAVPDSVHQVKVEAPCRLPRRRTMTRAAGSVMGTSMVSAASSTRERGRGPVGAASVADGGVTEALVGAAARGAVAAEPLSLSAGSGRSLAELDGGGGFELGVASGAGALGAGVLGGGAAASRVGGAVTRSLD